MILTRSVAGAPLHYRPTSGLYLKDDFAFGHPSSAIGELDWYSQAIGGGAAAAASGATAAGEDADVRGVIALNSQTGTAGRGTDWFLAGAVNPIPWLTRGNIPTGSYCEFKVRMQTSENDAYMWCGLLGGDLDAIPNDASAYPGIFFRIDTDGSGSGNWFGVVKDGAGGGNENTVDLGVGTSNTVGDWATLKWVRVATGFQFYVNGSAVGAIQTGNIPANDSDMYTLHMGVTTDDGGGAARQLLIDYCELLIKR